MRNQTFGRIADEVIGSFFPGDPPQFFRVPFSSLQIDPLKEAPIDAGFIGIAISVVRIE